MTSIHQSVGCSPIKPSFKSNQDVMTAAADWLESAGLNGYDEASFRDLEGVADKMNDGPIKTFAKIAAIATPIIHAIELSLVVRTLINPPIPIIGAYTTTLNNIVINC